MRKDEKRGEENHYLNIGLLELKSIVCQIHIENKDSEVWFGWNSQWLARLADLCRQPFGLVFSLRSMQTSWGVLVKGNKSLSLVWSKLGSQSLGFGKFFKVLQSPIGRMASRPMRSIERFPSKQMYL